MAASTMVKLTPAEASVVESLVTALIPPVSRDEALDVARACGDADPSPERLAALMAGGWSETVRAAFERSLNRLTLGERDELRLLLALLGSRVGTALLAGSGFAAFPDRSLAAREADLLGMAASRLPLRRKAFNALKRLCGGVAALAVDDGVERNAVNVAAGWRGPPPALFDAPAPAKATYAWPRGRLDEAYDVVVVGSGCGGGVAAATLSAAGHRVLVLEKAPLLQGDDFDGREGPAFEKLYERSALVATTDGSLGILAGSAFGGGSTINWACSLRTPRRVQDDWAALGVPCCARADGATPFDGALDAVCARLGVSDAGVTHDFGNRAILRGSAALKLPCRVLPQNLDRTDESAAYVAYGDRFGNKMSTPMTWLRDAAETGRCFFADGVKVDHVLRAGGRCVGVRCTRGGVARDVRATKAVVLSGGSLNTPAILLRTPGGFPNDHVGRHLRLHPVTPCASRFDGVDARALSASGLLAIGDGAPMTAACEAHVSGPKGDGYGALIEVPHSGLGIALTACPWLGARDCRELVYGASNLVSALVLQRDVGEGRVRLSAGDREPLVDYALDPRDAASMTEALVTCGRVLAAAGASRIASMHTAAPPTADLAGRDGAERAKRVDAWAAEVRARGLASDNRSTLLSAHQMGTCRMGRSQRDSVVDAAGESWELPGLYVVDASLFPTASGVNPMITTMALAKVVSDGLVRRLARGADASADAAKVARWAARDRRAGLAKLARAVAAAAAAAVVAVAVAGR